MSTVIRFTIVVGVVGFFLVSPAHGEIVSGYDIAQSGLRAIAGGFYALATGIAVGGIAIGVGLARQKK